MGWIYLRSLVLKEHRQSDAKNLDLVEKDWNSDDGIFDRLLSESLCLGLGMGQDHSQQLFNTGKGADK